MSSLHRLALFAAAATVLLLTLNAVSADGQRFIVASLEKVPTPETLTVLYNWSRALKP